MAKARPAKKPAKQRTATAPAPAPEPVVEIAPSPGSTASRDARRLQRLQQEKEVADLRAQGLTHQRVAERLGLSGPSQSKRIYDRMCRRLGSENTEAATSLALMQLDILWNALFPSIVAPRADSPQWRKRYAEAETEGEKRALLALVDGTETRRIAAVGAGRGIAAERRALLGLGKQVHEHTGPGGGPVAVTLTDEQIVRMSDEELETALQAHGEALDSRQASARTRKASSRSR